MAHIELVAVDGASVKDMADAVSQVFEQCERAELVPDAIALGASMALQREHLAPAHLPEMMAACTASMFMEGIDGKSEIDRSIFVLTFCMVLRKGGITVEPGDFGGMATQ